VLVSKPKGAGILSERSSSSASQKEGRFTMGKTLAVSVSMALALLLAGGLALAAPKGGTATTVIDCSAETASSCQGTSGPDVIYGTASADVIIPYGGDDVVYAKAGNDEVRHSFGNDRIRGGLGADTLRGGFGKDRIYGNRPATTLTGAQSDDVGDGVRDLIDCAYLASRNESGPDVGYGGDPDKDVVVDCSNRDDQ
jgi:Ca2+-binding RTX toxin-like protein